MDSQLYVRSHLGAAWVRVAQNATDGPSGFRDARVLFDGTLVTLGPQLEMYVYDPIAPGGAWSLVPNSQSAGGVVNVGLGVHSMTQLPDGTLAGVGYDVQLYTMQSLGEPWLNSKPGPHLVLEGICHPQLGPCGVHQPRWELVLRHHGRGSVACGA